jgi:hypothetical protein
MKSMQFSWRAALWLAALAPVVLFGPTVVAAGPFKVSSAVPSATQSQPLGQVVALRRLTESQYRNSIADIFGPDIKVAGRFEPIVRPTHELIATAAAESTISPAGLEQFDAIARNVAEQVFDDAHRALNVKCAPADARKADASCARDVLTPIGRYVFRRPLTADEQAGYIKIAGDAAATSGSFYAGLKFAVASMLVSPDFLYVVESAEPDPDHPGELRLDNYSRAARLSFLLWDTTPNETLLQAAARGQLTNQARLTAIAGSMVKSPRVESGARAFFTDMLIFEKFDDMSKDPIIFPRYNPEVANALPEQLLRTIVDLLVTRQADYREMFTTRRTFVNRALGPVYEVQVRDSQNWVPYEFGPNDDRAGVLGQAGFLALGAAQTGRSSPTIRGRAIREVLLCQPVPNPPGNVSFDDFLKTNNLAKPTARIRLTEHATNPVCAGCHRITDPIGLSLEKFDGIGSPRATENGAPIDTSGIFDGVKYSDATGLGKAMAASRSSTACVATRALDYATGRSNDGNKALQAALDKGFAADKYRFPALLLRIATMPEAYRVPTARSKSDAAKIALVAPLDIGARR